MKKLLFLLVAGLSLVSCSTSIRTVDTDHGRMKFDTHIPFWYLSQSPRYDYNHFDAQNKPVVIYDTLGCMWKSWPQAWYDTRVTDKGLFIGAMAAAGASAGVVTYQALWGIDFRLATAVGVVSLALAADEIEWEKWNSFREVRKQYYDSVMVAGGDFSAFWSATKN